MGSKILRRLSYGLATVILVQISQSDAASAGTRDGGGGIGVRCPQGTGAPKDFELLDLHQARLDGVKVSYDPQMESDAVDLSTTLFANHIWYPATITVTELKQKLAGWFVPIFNGQDWTDPDDGTVYHFQYVQSLPLSNDIGNYHIAPGCHLEQIAYFDDVANTLSIASNWDELDWLDRSALASHELVYFLDRREGMEYFGTNTIMTSEKSREFIGGLFSEVGIKSYSDSIPASGFAQCADTGSNAADATAIMGAFDNG